MIHKKLTSGIVAGTIIFSLFIASCGSGSMGSGDANLETNIDSVSYAFGYLNGQQMGQQGMDDLDPQTFAKGMEEALNAEEGDSAKISRSQMMAMLQRYQMKAKKKMQQQQQKDAKKNKEEGQTFLEENKGKEGVKTTESGLQYKILSEGSGASPSAEDTVVVAYTGTKIDGTEFDSRDSVSFPLNGVIEGWTEGIQLMKEGAEYKFWIPGSLAYKARGRGQAIGPNELLIFEVELKEVKEGGE